MRYGFIGLGIMGSRMAARLARLTDAPLVLWNRSAREAANYTRGDVATPPARWVPSAAEAAASSDILFVMVSTPEAAIQVVEGPSGVLDGVQSEGTQPIVVNTSTVDPTTARRLDRHVRTRGAMYLDAPVLGSRVAAESGQLLFLAGGDAETLERCAEPLRLLGRDVVHTGAAGTGSSAKLVFNALLGAGMAAMAEALTLGASLGVPRDFILERVLESPVVPVAVQAKRTLLQAGAEDPHFPLKWMLKDLRLAASAGDGDLPLIRAAAEHFEAAVLAGRADHDFSAVALQGRPE